MGVPSRRTHVQDPHDIFKTKMMESIKQKLKQVNTHTAVIPVCLTSQLQPLDVSINKPFKEKVRNRWSDWMAGTTDHTLCRQGRLKKPSISLWCQWVLKERDEVDAAIIIKALKKRIIPHA